MIKIKSALYLFLLLGIFSCKSTVAYSGTDPDSVENKPTHVKVFYEEGRYGGWPANWGIWSWGDEILVGFTEGDHLDKESHTFDRESSYAMFARSLDGGESWSTEDALASGITEATFEHNLGSKSQPARELDTSIDFSHPDLALTFRMCSLLEGPSSFYYSYDRGKTWQGAFRLSVDFQDKTPAGIVTRTDYIVEGRNEVTAFLTVSFLEGDKDWREVACVRTTDGGKTWNHISWIGPAGIGSIMPSSVRLDPSSILTMIRVTKPPRMVSYASSNNGLSWQQLENPVLVDRNGNPPALLKLADGRLCLVYGLRSENTRPEGIGMYVTFSSDNGQSWTEPTLLRGKDGAVWDIGYPRAVQLPNGNVVAVYYYNNADLGDKYRYIAATIFNPDNF